MDYNILIKGGTVVDGSGAPAYAADVRVRGGLIMEIGGDITAQRGERVVDAAGCYVTPGLIEGHNHWDAAVWWSPNMEPLPAYGVTTSVNGNCGFSLAPMVPETRTAIAGIMNYFEDIPEPPMEKYIAWDWTTFSEYKASHQRNVKTPVNFACYCGHVAMRLAVMRDAAWTRAATPDEIARMCALLDDAMQAGAMGLSTNELDEDKNRRPLPSRYATDEEYAALLAVLSRYPGSTFQVVLDYFRKNDGPEIAERLGALATAAGVRMQWVGVPTLQFQAAMIPASLAMHEKFKAEGRDMWTGFHHLAPTTAVNFTRTLSFGFNNNPVWQQLVDTPDWADKKAMLEDPAWLASARESWDGQYAYSAFREPEAMWLRDSESGFGPIGITFAQYIEQGGFAHPSDALAEWVLNNGAESVVQKDALRRDEGTILHLLRDPMTVGNFSDSGAHGKLFCGAGDNIFLLTDFVRDKGVLTIEEGIHVLTGKLANYFSLHDRGLIEVGKVADIAVFNLDEVECRPEEKVWDVADGEGGRTYRYNRAAAPMRLTLVNGVPTFDHGAFTGKFPGTWVSPAPATTRAPEPA